MADYAELVATLERCAERARRGPLGRLVISVGPSGAQSLKLIHKRANGRNTPILLCMLRFLRSVLVPPAFAPNEIFYKL